MTRLPENPEPILAPEYAEGFICPRCGHRGPVPSYSQELGVLRLQCVQCGFFVDYGHGD